MRNGFVVLMFIFLSEMLSAQMWNGQDTLYGNEWINYDQSYLKIKVSEDGVYKIPFYLIQDKIPSGTEGKHFQLFYKGEEVPVYTSSENVFGTNDFIEFYGKKNRGEFDRWLFNNPDAEQMNPSYSLFTDTSAYFLTWNDENIQSERIEGIQNDISGFNQPELFFNYEAENFYAEASIKKTTVVSNTHLSRSTFDEGQGWSSPWVAHQTFTLNTPQIYTQASNEARFEIRILGRALAGFQDSLVLNGEEILSQDYSKHELKNTTVFLPLNLLSETNTFSAAGLPTAAGDASRLTVSNIKITYPHTFNFENKTAFKFKIEASPDIKYLEIADFDGGDNPMLYDLTNNLRMEATVESGLVKIALPPSVSDRVLILVNETKILEITEIEETDFVNYWDEEGDFIFLTNTWFFDDEFKENMVKTYADYRRTSEGGAYNPIIVDVEQLYDQFGYGVARSPISIRNFGHFILKYWSNPKYVFIIGKGREYQDIRTNDEMAEHNLNTFFVPTYGSPGADNLLFAKPGTHASQISIGRLPAKSGADIRKYLDKILEFEANKNLPQTYENKAWMKRIIHLGGGDVDDQQAIKNHLTNFKNTIENNGFGGNVVSFFKKSSAPIQTAQSELLFESINGGASIITFFGHSSATGFDFTVDSPQSYKNKGKYPLMLSFGCLSGQCHLDQLGVGQNFIFAEESGAAAFIASTGVGFISSLGLFGKDFYTNVGEGMYGEGIGDIMRVANEKLSPSGWIGDQLLASQTTLQGDPSLRLNVHDGSDFVTDIGSVSHNPALVNLQFEEVVLDFDVANIGITNRDTFEMKIAQELPTGEIINLHTERVRIPKFKEHFSVRIPTIKRPEAVGQNYYHIQLDTGDEIEELPNPGAEENNELVSDSGRKGFPVLITSNDLVPIYPTEFAIVNDPNLTLKATTANVFAPEQMFVFEIDTCDLFNTSFKQRFEIDGSGGVLKWKPNISYENEQVYYWRVSPDSTDAETGYRWFHSSFVFLDNHPDGWNQSHFFQYKKGSLHNKTLKEPHRELRYIEDFKEIHIWNRMMVGLGLLKPRVVVNNEDVLHWWPEINSGVYVVVLDGQTVDAWFDLSGNPYGDDGYGRGSFPFLTSNEAHRAELIEFLENTVPSGNYILFYTFQKPNTTYLPEEWAADSVNLGTNIFQVLEKQGAQFPRLLEDEPVPYIFFYKKDDTAFQPVERITELDGIISEDLEVFGVWDSGDLTSDRIGPVAKWNEFQFELSGFNPDEEEAYFQVWGINDADTEILLKDNITETSTDISDIDNSEYPYLRLKYFSKDPIDRTPPQLENWRILYEELPEAALNPMAFFQLEKDTFQQGELLELKIAVENIGDLDMDSLLIDFKLIDSDNGQEVIRKRLRPLLVEDTIIASLNIDTRTISGHHTLIIDANPNNDQPELTHQNNVGIRSFFIRDDRRNPLLDVTFDGIHIMEGDIVSSKTEIKIVLEDENEYLALSDTSLFKVWLQYPDEFDPVLIPFNSGLLEFFPADVGNLDKENKARIEFKPDLFKDGTYKLLVQANDVTGNASGKIDYNISFEVISKAMISNVLNYPNPFTTSTQFVYTLTGSEIPAFYKIQIMTVSGRIVREIDQTELGALRIGTHKTEFAWNGTDQFGDRLANGVYLYRFVTKNADGSDYEHFQRDSVDRYFQKGFGKMVLLK